LKNNTIQLLCSTFIVILIALTRLFPHSDNFVPVFAMILFASVHFKNKWQAILISVGALWISDLYLNNWGRFSEYYNEFVLFSSPFNYFSYMIIALIGMQIFKNSITLPKVFGGSLLAGVAFFIISNFGVWMNPLYAKTLWACYIDAIPFFRATLASNILFSAVLFGGYYLLQKDFKSLKLNHIQYSKF